MIIEVLVKPASSANCLLPMDGEKYVFRTTEIAKNGAVNTALIKALSQEFKVPKTDVNIKLGLKSTKKILEINL